MRRVSSALLDADPRRARNAGIDALRIGTRFLVLLHHTAITYGAVGGWYYKEAPTDGSLSSMLLVFFCTLNQAWFMVRVGVADLRPRRGAVACTRRAASGA